MDPNRQYGDPPSQSASTPLHTMPQTFQHLPYTHVASMYQSHAPGCLPPQPVYAPYPYQQQYTSASPFTNTHHSLNQDDLKYEPHTYTSIQETFPISYATPQAQTYSHHHENHSTQTSQPHSSATNPHEFQKPPALLPHPSTLTDLEIIQQNNFASRQALSLYYGLSETDPQDISLVTRIIQGYRESCARTWDNQRRKWEHDMRIWEKSRQRHDGETSYSGVLDPRLRDDEHVNSSRRRSDREDRRDSRHEEGGDEDMRTRRYDEMVHSYEDARVAGQSSRRVFHEGVRERNESERFWSEWDAHMIMDMNVRRATRDREREQEQESRRASRRSVRVVRERSVRRSDNGEREERTRMTLRERKR